MKNENSHSNPLHSKGTLQLNCITCEYIFGHKCDFCSNVECWHCELNYVDFVGIYLKSLTLLKIDFNLKNKKEEILTYYAHIEHWAFGIGNILFIHWTSNSILFNSFSVRSKIECVIPYKRSIILVIMCESEEKFPDQTEKSDSG